jgi:ribose 5-phosphate isomerase B
MLTSSGYRVIDVGTMSEESTDYPDYARRVAMTVAQGEAKFGVLVCGTGIGMSIAANKVKGIRAAVVTDEFTAQMSKQHNNTNVFCAGARTLEAERMKKLLKLWLETPFEGGRHTRRLQKIEELEKQK